MLTFRKTNIGLAIVLVTMVVFHFTAGVSLWYFLVPAFVYSLVLFYGCTYINSGFFMPVICTAKTSLKQVAISFDDGPAKQYSPEILAFLKQEKVPAAFFIIGSRIAGNEVILQQMYADGHLIGNHSLSHHFFFDMWPAQKMLDDMQAAGSAIQSITGSRPKLFRPPYGVMNPNLKKAIIKGDYTPVGWSVRSLDTVAKDGEKLLKKLIAALNPGAVFLFHDTCKITLEILPLFVKKVQEQGYEIVRLDKLLHLKPYA